jgi:hypothetical protein
MENIKVNLNDLSSFFMLISKYGEAKKNPYLVDSSQTLWDHFFGEEPIISDLVNFSKGEVKFVGNNYPIMFKNE